MPPSPASPGIATRVRRYIKSSNFERLELVIYVCFFFRLFQGLDPMKFTAIVETITVRTLAVDQLHLSDALDRAFLAAFALLDF